jgi:hypothetical protein
MQDITNSAFHRNPITMTQTASCREELGGKDSFSIETGNEVPDLIVASAIDCASAPRQTAPMLRKITGSYCPNSDSFNAGFTS